MSDLSHQNSPWKISIYFNIILYLWNQQLGENVLNKLIAKMDIKTNRKVRLKLNDSPFLGDDNSNIDLNEFFNQHEREIKLMVDIYYKLKSKEL